MRIEAGLDDFEDFSPLAPGTYDFIIKKPVDVTPNVDEKNDIGGNLYTFVVYPEVESGEKAGKEVRRQLSNRSKASRFFLRNFLERIGVEVSVGGSFATEDMLGRRFRAVVMERTYKDKDGNEKKAADFDDRSIIGL